MYNSNQNITTKTIVFVITKLHLNLSTYISLTVNQISGYDDYIIN